MRHFRKFRKILATVMILALLIPAMPAALAESFSAFVQSSSMTVYADSGLTSKIGALAQYTVVTVTKYSGGVARIELNGKTGYAKVSDMTRVDAVAEPAVVNASAKVYQKASTSSKSASVAKNTKVNVIEVKGSWALIERNGVGGYIKAQYLTFTAETPILTASPTLAPTADLSKAIPAVVSASSVTVYNRASTSGTSLGSIKKGTEVNVLDSSNGWAYIEMNGRYGYCKISALTPKSSVTPAPTATPDLSKAIPAVANVSVTVYQSASTSSKSLGTLKKGVQVNVLDSSSGWAYIEMNGRYGYCKISALTPVSSVTPAPTATPDLSKAIPAVANVSVTVYQSASTSSKSLGTLKKGVQVNVLNVNGGWAYIEMSGRYGYCKVSALTPVSSVTPSPTPDLSKAIPAVVTASKLMVYDSASTSGKELGAIKKGTKVNVIQISGGWAYIEMNGRYGFCKVSGLAPEASATPDPLEGYVKETFSATVVVNGAKLYASASTSAASANLPLGTDVTVGAYSAEWAYVKVGETLGFIKVSALSKSQFAALSKGSSGSTVSTLEKALLAMGYFDGNPDTTFDAYTESAVKMFQEACGLSADGKASQSLQRVLYSGNGPVCSLLSGSYAKGSTGSNVSRIQLRLYALGYLSKTSSVDGDYGTTTANAVALFQKVSGLSQTGTADSSTLRKMYSTSAAKLPSGTTPADQGGSVIQPPNGSGQANNSTKISAGLASTTSKLTSGMSMAEKLEYVIYVGQNQLGKPYVYGANGTSSYDCTGFTVYCFKQIGITLKRTAVNQGYDDTYTKISGVSNLRRGDLVYFNTVSDSDLSDHAGIYLGDGWFIHASSGQGKVVISSLTSGYYNRVFSWGRRVY